MPDETFGSIGYAAYARSTGGKTYDGRDMPTWNALPQNIRTAWCDAAAAIRTALPNGPATPEGSK